MLLKTYFSSILYKLMPLCFELSTRRHVRVPRPVRGTDDRHAFLVFRNYPLYGGGRLPHVNGRVVLHLHIQVSFKGKLTQLEKTPNGLYVTMKLTFHLQLKNLKISFFILHLCTKNEIFRMIPFQVITSQQILKTYRQVKLEVPVTKCTTAVSFCCKGLY